MALATPTATVFKQKSFLHVILFVQEYIYIVYAF